MGLVAWAICLLTSVPFFVQFLLLFLPIDSNSPDGFLGSFQNKLDLGNAGFPHLQIEDDTFPSRWLWKVAGVRTCIRTWHLVDMRISLSFGGIANKSKELQSVQNLEAPGLWFLLLLLLTGWLWDKKVLCPLWLIHLRETGVLVPDLFYWDNWESDNGNQKCHICVKPQECLVG